MGDVFKIWAWALASLVLGLLFTPVAFNGGKALSELSISKDFNGLVNKFAAWSGAARLEDFFKVCWPLGGLLLLFPLIEWLRLADRKRGGGGWSVHLPHGAKLNPGSGQPIAKNRWGPLQVVTGFCLTFGAFVLIGYAMVRAGSFEWEPGGGGWSKNLWMDLGLALVVAASVETFFRRVILGVFLRAMGVVAAVVLSAMMFAAVSFILSGLDGTGGGDAEALTPVGLGRLLLFGGDPVWRVVAVFLPWFAFGCVLGWARWRTASVWLPIGLLTGWLLADSLFSKATNPLPVPDKVASYVATGSLHEGIIPLMGVIVVGGLVHVITHGYSFKRRPAVADQSA